MQTLIDTADTATLIAMLATAVINNDVQLREAVLTALVQEA